MRSKFTLAVGILAGTLTLAACNDKPAAAPAPTPATPTAKPSSPSKPPSGKVGQVRFVLLADGKLAVDQPSAGLVNNGKAPATTSKAPDDDTDTTTDSPTPDADTDSSEATGDSTSESSDTPTTSDSADPDTTTTSAAPGSADVQPGTPSDYTKVAAGSHVTVDGKAVVDVPEMAADQRATIVIGPNVDGKLVATGFLEKGGKITGEFGTSKLLNTTAPKPDKATVYGVGVGLGLSKDHKSLTLGTSDKGCLADKATSTTTHVAYPVEPGDVDLGWFDDAKCKTAAGDTQKETLTAGQYAYAFAWITKDGTPKLVFLPVDTA